MNLFCVSSPHRRDIERHKDELKYEMAWVCYNSAKSHRWVAGFSYPSMLHIMHSPYSALIEAWCCIEFLDGADRLT